MTAGAARLTFSDRSNKMNDTEIDMTVESTMAQVPEPTPGRTDEPIIENHSPVNDWNRTQIHPSTVKQEPMDDEQTAQSPNNDSGISPGHVSTGSSAGRSSPHQNGPQSSPDQYVGNKPESDVDKMQLSYYGHLWGLSHYVNHLVPQTCLPGNQMSSEVPMPPKGYQPYFHGMNPTNLNINQTTTSTQMQHASMTPVMTTSAANKSPNSNLTTASHVPSPRTSPQNIIVTPDVHGPPGLNPGLSDDNNSRSSSTCSSSESMMETENDYYKIMGIQTPSDDQNPLRRLQMTVEQTTMMGAANNETSSALGATSHRNLFQCAFCDFNTVSRAEFNDHNKTHCPDQKCSHCDFTTKSIEELQNHLRDAHMLSPSAEEIAVEQEDEPGVKVPRVNSQGKLKTLKCKQCTFIAYTKQEFWNHHRIHIKPDKLLTCPRCPFVTEYKHHLEYHLRNHAKSKPFKCSHCKYSCVNKSMLNSHLKSHSTVYQYSCASCTYITKYCHSLKLHLRKYQHKPAMVLNPDGTPNPHPIIDVYGTRRGPKQRPRNNVKELPTSKDVQTYAYPVTPPSYGYAAQQPGDMSLYQYSTFISNAFPMNNNNNPFVPAFPHNVVAYTQEKSNDTKDSKGTVSNEKSQNMLNAHYYRMNNNNIVREEIIKEMAHEQQQQQLDMHIREKEKCDESLKEVKVTNGTPLDLSKPESMNTTGQRNADATANNVSIPLNQSTPKTSVKNRRKGQAFKLEHISWKLQQQSAITQENGNATDSNIGSVEKPEDEREIIVRNEKHVPEIGGQEIRKGNEDLRKTDPAKDPIVEKSATSEKKEYSCEFCGIIFIDAVLYMIHKGYHGFQDPFQCNMCGELTGDKIEFNLHIARKSHC